MMCELQNLKELIFDLEIEHILDFDKIDPALNLLDFADPTSKELTLIELQL